MSLKSAFTMFGLSSVTPFLLVLYSHILSVTGKGIDLNTIDIGRAVTKVTLNDQDDVIFLGGRNFISMLSYDLQIIFKLDIGPVYEEEYCYPNLAPCDNIVTVLEFDKFSNGLLVCGTAYQGTCAMHDSLQFSEWICVNSPKNQTTANRVSAPQVGSTVVQILNTFTEWREEEIQPAGQTFPVNCRSFDYGMEIFDMPPIPASEHLQRPVESRMRREIDVINEGVRIPEISQPIGPVDVVQQARLYFATRILVASWTKPETTSNIEGGQPLISVRKLRRINYDFEMRYPKEHNVTNTGIHVNPILDKDFISRFKYVFTSGGNSYLLSQQVTMCQSNGGGSEKCTSTVLSRVNASSPSVIPYLEMPLLCNHKNVKYDLLLSSTIGTVSSHASGSYEEVQLLIVAFGKELSQGAGIPDPAQDTAICVFSIETIDNTFDSYMMPTCENGTITGGLRPPFWIKEVEDVCVDNETVDYIQIPQMLTDSDVTVFHRGLVMTILTHTPVYREGEDKQLYEKMDVFTVDEEGKIHKFGVKAVISNTWYKAKIISRLKFVHDVGQSGQRADSVGVTDQERAMIYLAYGTQFISLGLDYCRQYVTCNTCRQNSDGTCRWSPNVQSCLVEGHPRLGWNGAPVNSCPPQLDDFSPKYVPITGGSTITLRGLNLGSPKEEGDVTVTVCDQLCDNVKPNVNTIECRVRAKCIDCSFKCFLNIEVKQQASYGNVSSISLSGIKQLTYVVPMISSVRPDYGPVSGGIFIEAFGENLNVGTSSHLEILGVKCQTIANDVEDTLLRCQMGKGSSLQDICGPVTLHIDDYVTVANDSIYCFKEDPKIFRVEPTATLVRGGLTLTLTGSSLDSVSFLTFRINVTILNNNVTIKEIFTSYCMGDSHTTMTCKTPSMLRVEKHLSNVSNSTSSLEGNMAFVLESREPVVMFPDSTFHIHPVPEFQPVRTKSRTAFIYPRLKDNLYRIQGQNIPEWLKIDDIEVTVGTTPCPVKVVKSDHVLCDVSYILAVYEQNYDAFLRSLRSTSSPNLSDTTNQIDKATDDTIKNTRVVAPDSSKNTAVNKLPGSSITATYNRPETPVSWQSVDLREIRTNYDGATNETVNKTFQYTLKIKIGFFDQSLGVVYVGPLPENITVSTPPTVITTEEPKTSSLNYILIGAIVGSAVLLIVPLILVCAVFCIKRRKIARARALKFYMNDLLYSQPGFFEEKMPSLNEILEAELEEGKKTEISNLIISPERLILGTAIGSGNFGTVYEGVLAPKDKEQPLKVAVKTVKASRSVNLAEFVKEALIMIGFEHPHVLGLVGLVEKEMGVPYVVLPYMANGDLLTYVRDRKKTLSLYDVMEFGADICNGMAYMSSAKLVHRDLAARNCMLDNEYRAKVADFGLCRDIYEKGYYTSDNKKKLPIRWMAVESIERGAYSTKSDVWSMGVVLWEMLSRGMTPYPGVDGWDIINFLKRRRLAPPYFCPDELYRLMMTCWAKDPETRPTFKTLQRELLLLMGKDLESDSAAPLLPAQSQKVTGHLTMSKSNKSLESTKSKHDNRGRSQSQSTSGTLREKIPTPDTQQDIDLRHAKLSKQESSAKDRKDSVMSLPHCEAVQNVIITIPNCYNFNENCNTDESDYLVLVDHYEEGPRFSNLFRRSKRKGLKMDSRKAKSRKQRTSSRGMSDRFSDSSERTSVQNDYLIPHMPLSMSMKASGEGPGGMQEAYPLDPDNNRIAVSKGDSNCSQKEINPQRPRDKSGSLPVAITRVHSAPRFPEENNSPNARGLSTTSGSQSVAFSENLTPPNIPSTVYDRLSNSYMEKEEERPHYYSFKETKVKFGRDAGKTKNDRIRSISEQSETTPEYSLWQDPDIGTRPDSDSVNQKRMSDLDSDTASCYQEWNMNTVQPHAVSHSENHKRTSDSDSDTESCYQEWNMNAVQSQDVSNSENHKRTSDSDSDTAPCYQEWSEIAVQPEDISKRREEQYMITSL